MLSETGNPTIVSLRGITEALGFRLEVVPLGQEIQEDEGFAVPKTIRRGRKVRL
jgi:hypothetical protein